MSLPVTAFATLGYYVFKNLSAAPGGASYPVPDALAQLFGGAAGNLFHGDINELRAELTSFITGRQPDSNQDLELDCPYNNRIPRCRRICHGQGQCAYDAESPQSDS
jgi:hypothetical protein